MINSLNSSFSINRSDLNENTANDIFNKRYNVFHKRLQWDVKIEDNKEIDNYDDLNPVYVVSKSNGSVAGSMRLLPTTGIYMLKDTFPDALEGELAPTDNSAWEISRFFVEKDRNNSKPGDVNIHTIELMRSAYYFATSNSISQFVMVTTVAIERYMKFLGFKTERFGRGKSVYLGKEKSVALKLNINDDYLSVITTKH